MNIQAGNNGQPTLPQQGKAIDWVLWALLSTLALVALTRDARANVVSTGQTTFPAVAVGQTSAPVPVTLIAQQAGTTTAPLVLTDGVSTPALAEFAIADSGTCGANPVLGSGQNCTVAVTFTPRFPGVRHGAVLLKNSGGQLLAGTVISGIGQGGLPVLVPGQIDTVAGDGQWFYQGDGVPATQAPIYLPSGLAVDGAGNLFLADSINNRVRRVDATTHIITTVAGNGTAGTHGDNGPATAAEVTSPSGLAIDGAGNLYIADTGNNAIRRVDATTGEITTVAGTLGQSGYTGDGGPASTAKLDAPQGIALTPAGDILIADTSNHVVRLLTVNDGKIRTLAGTGTAGYNGDNILATSAQLNDPSAVAIRSDGAIAIADLSNNRVRLFTPGGNITTVAGSGTLGYTGDGGPATQAELQGPAAVAFDPAGDLLIADSVNNCIRLVFGAQKTIVTLAGNPSDDRYAGDGGPENQARMHGPDGIVFDAHGNLWFSDRFNNRVREVSSSLLTIGPYPTMKVGKTSQPSAEAMLNGGNQPLNLSSPVLQQAALDPSTTTCTQTSLASGSFCKMGVEFVPTIVGPSINGAITWNSDAPNVTPVDQLYGEVLSVEPTSVAITSSANPGLLGQSILLTATVTSDDTGRTGTVDLVEGGTTWCSGVQLSGAGTASCQLPSLSLGNHTFTANYSGDNNNAASQSPGFIETIKQQAALALGVSTSPATVTSNVTFTISAADTYGMPTGTVVFYDSTTALATVTLDNNGHASWSTSTFSVGIHTLSAQYSGDTSNVAGTSNTKSLEVDQASTTTVLSSGNNDATVGSSVALTANVVSNNGPAPTGSVHFLDGQTDLGSGTLTGNGSASIMVSTLTPGTHILTAVYSGDTDSATSTSAPVNQIVQQIGTATTLGADVDPANAGATVHLTAIVSMSPGATADGDLSGTVTFHDGNNTLGSAPINATGQATLAVSSFSVGSHPVIASFSGNVNYALSNSTTLNETVQQTATAITLSSASSTTLMGKPALFTAVITSPTGTPTGTVTFKDGSAIVATAPVDAHGIATLSTSNLGTGNHLITAVYSGDANYLASTSAGLQQTVTLATTTLSLAGPNAAVDAGTTVQFVAALATPGVAPTGTVVLLDGAAIIGTQPVTAAGTFSFTSSRLTVGSHQLTATYSGDVNNAANTSARITVLVQQARTVTTLVPSANPLTQGDTLTLTAAVTSDSPNLGNSISFYDGPTLLATVSLNASGAASFAPRNLTIGTHPLTAVYSGDTNHAGSTSATVSELAVQNSSVSLSSSANPSVSGNSVALTAQVKGNPIPTGSITFRADGAVLATVPLDSTGIASFAIASLPVGSHAISATYSGDTNFSTNAAQLTETVINAATQASLTLSNNPATYGQPLTLSATVASNGGAATGTVDFLDAGTVIGSSSLNSNGNAALTLSSLAPGQHTLTASYRGDGKASASASAPLALTVKQTTTLSITSSTNPAQTLSPINLTATLANAGAASATGAVIFTDGATVLGSIALDTSGHATLNLPQLAAGDHNIIASYAGDGSNFPTDSPAYKQTIQLRPTSTTVTGTSTDPSNPQQITLISVVHGSGNVPPGGTVNFTAGSITLGAATVDSTGVAAITVIFESPTQQVVAMYAGDPSYASSQSAATPITAGQPAQFTLSLSNPTITLASHQRTSITVALGSIKGFTDNIALGCLGLPYAATCTFDKSQLKLAADGTATATLTIDTGDPLGAGTSTSASLSTGRNTLLCALPAGLLLAGLLSKKRRLRLNHLLVLLVVLALGSGLTGCSGLQMSGTAPGTYSFRVIGTGQGSNTTQAQTVNLVVPQ